MSNNFGSDLPPGMKQTDSDGGEDETYRTCKCCTQYLHYSCFEEDDEVCDSCMEEME